MPDSTYKNIFLAGAAKGIITPPLGTLLFGYPIDRPAKSVNDDLTSTAIVFSNGKAKAALISLTICSIPEALCKRIKKMIEQKTDIHHFIFGTTHTHSGPSTVNSAGWGTADTHYIEEILIPEVVKTVIRANQNLQPAELGIGETESLVGLNRRQIKEDGSISLGGNPWGILDKRMRVLSVRSTIDRKIIATMVHYGAHGTAAGGTYNPIITRDWSGVMTDRLEAITEAPCLFLLGAEGDVAPRAAGPSYFSDGTQNLERLDQALELGGRAACDAKEAYQKIKIYHVPEFTVITGQIALPYEPLPDAAEAKLQLARLEGASGGMMAYEKKHWESVIEYADKEPQTALCYDQTIIRLGEVVIIPHPFEIFTQIALRLDSYSPFAYTLSLANANGTNGYLPNKEEICRGGYEVWSARYRAGYTLTEDADTEIITQNLALLRKEKNKQ